MNYAIDTDVAIDYLKGKKGAVDRLQDIPSPALPAPVAAELYYGAYRSGNPEKNTASLSKFLKAFDLLGTDQPTSRIFGILKAGQEAKGQARDDFYLLIAASCIANGCTLVTRNIRHYADLPGLKVERI
jgi:tRNA(fMet)-specific endonuclease VapC